MTWPEVTDIKNPRYTFCSTDELIIFCKFHNFSWNIEAVARLEINIVVGSLDLTWWPDLTWHWVEIFTKVAEKMGVNPVSGRLLATPISGRGGCLGPPLISPVLTGRFFKFKLHSFCLNMIYISKKEISKIRKRGVLGGQKPWISDTFLITYYRHVCEPILMQQVAFDRELTSYSHVFVTFENSKIIGGYRSLNMGVQKYKINRCSQPLSRPDGCEISLKSDSEML